jgi:hypothetical protein
MPQRKKRRTGARPIAQVLEDAERLIAAWNERQAKRMPTLFSPTIGAAEHPGQQRIRCFGGNPVFHAHQPHTRRMGRLVYRQKPNSRGT